MSGPLVTEAQKEGRLAGGSRLAVIDIGSNSIRLVVYRQHGRYPFPLFNERVSCRLGLGMDKKEKLRADRIEAALAVLRRFSRIIDTITVDEVQVIATAAVRRARNAADFVQPAEQILGHPVQVLPSEEEARLVSLGLTANMPGISGLITDLGGGSIEMVLVKEGKPAHMASLNMGHLTQLSKAEISAQFARIDWLDEAAGQPLYGIGGSIRALGAAFVARTDYPLFLLHGLTIEAGALNGLLADLTGERTDLSGVPMGRRDTIGKAALIIEALVEASSVARLVVSSTSIRDGVVADRLGDQERATDPLILACREIAAGQERFIGLADALIDLLQPIIQHFDGRLHRRLIEAACLLSDMCWNEYADLRGFLAAEKILALPVNSLSHRERAWLASAVRHRYDGVKPNRPAGDIAEQLLREHDFQTARAVGTGLRFALIFCAGARDLLEQVSLHIEGEMLICRIPEKSASLMDEHSRRRLDSLAEACDLTAEVVFVT